MSGKRYAIKECFYSLQGEGVRAGSPNVFVRFAGCNLDCRKPTHGFDCDTDFMGGERLTAEQIASAARALSHGRCHWLVLTGGEPALQLDDELVGTLRRDGFKLAIETNGTIALPRSIDWICVSPKVPEEALVQRRAHEVKYVVSAGAPLPRTQVEADHYLISPAFEVASKTNPRAPGQLDRETLAWCIELCLANPPWRLSVQLHKHWQIR